MTCARLLIAGLLVTLIPCPAQAQADAFARATAALAVAATEPEATRTASMRAAVPPMLAALDRWDRYLDALESRIDRELVGAAPARQVQLHVELAVAYGARGRLSEALRRYDEAAALQPSSDLQLLRGLTLESAGRADDAARAFRAAWQLEPSNPVKAYYALRRGGAVSEAERSRAREVIAGAYQTLAGLATRPDRPPFVTLEAVPDTLSPTPVVGDRRTARAFSLIAAGRFRDGVTALSELDSPSGTTGTDPLAHFFRAQGDEAANRVSDARREYAASLPGTLAGRSVIFVAIGRLAQVEGDVDAAVSAFTQAVRLNPNDPTMHRELAGAYSAAGSGDEALVELIAGLLIDPANAALHAAVGQLHLDAGRPADAVPAFTRALDLNPSQYEVRYALAAALTRLGRTDEAARQLETFERVRVEMLERRRRDIQQEVDREEAIRRGLTNAGSAR